MVGLAYEEVYTMKPIKARKVTTLTMLGFTPGVIARRAVCAEAIP